MHGTDHEQGQGACCRKSSEESWNSEIIWFWNLFSLVEIRLQNNDSNSIARISNNLDIKNYIKKTVSDILLWTCCVAVIKPISECVSYRA